MIANILSAFEEDGATYVGFATDSAGAEYVTLSLADGSDPQDKALGLGGLHIEVNDQSNSGYDLVRWIKIEPSAVTLTVDKTVCSDAIDALRIEIPPQAPDRVKVLAALREICRAAAVPVEG
ncbi:hypothetical protein [Yoonia sp. SDW83-1]|uniref:hypothetical protein n=1 Tax=Yoonia sp. SDW83-1 TaxID=3366945 RepID=UPI00398C2818